MHGVTRADLDEVLLAVHMRIRGLAVLLRVCVCVCVCVCSMHFVQAHRCTCAQEDVYRHTGKQSAHSTNTREDYT